MTGKGGGLSSCPGRGDGIWAARAQSG